MARRTIEESPFAYFFFANTKSAWLWLALRLYLGWQWFSAGWEKANDPAWIGGERGTALAGFVHGALTKTSGPHPDVQWWYASFLQQFVLPHVVTWSYAVTGGEILIGIALILGFLTGITAFFGTFMNLNFMLAGTVSVNPIWFTLSLGLILAWRVSGYFGLDRYVLPRLPGFLRPRNL